MENIKYPYSRKRSEFGKPCFFQTEPGSVTCSIEADEEVQREFKRANTVDAGKQTGVDMTLSQVNTIRTEFKETGLNHVEGGWPRDVNPNDIESTSRYKKKLERDEHFSPTILKLANTVEHLVLQNNTLDVYRDHFGAGDSEDEDDEEHVSATVINTYHDPLADTRSISEITWCPGTGGGRLAASYVDYRFSAGVTQPTDSYIWDTQNPYEPESRLSGGEQLLSLQYSVKHNTVLAAGGQSGRVCWFDTRRGAQPVERTSLDHSHRQPVYSTVWLSSKAGTELFTASSDAVVKWWDTRQLGEPLETLTLEVRRPEQPARLVRHGATVLEYESTMPTRFMVGTEQGHVLVCNRRGKSQAEKIPIHFAAHTGQIKHLERNPINLKTFLTVGDRCAKIWSEDSKDYPICWAPSDGSRVNSGAWSPTRPSVFYTAKANGVIDVWDVIRQQQSPVLSLKISERPLETIKVHHTGAILATGSHTGTIAMLRATGCASISRQSRALLQRLFDNERGREKLVDLKVKELRLQQKLREDTTATDTPQEPLTGTVFGGEKRQQELQALADTHSVYGEQRDRERRRLQLQRQRVCDVGLECPLAERDHTTSLVSLSTTLDEPAHSEQ